jgi:hypothetical protein
MPQNAPVIACTRFLTISSRVGSAHLSSRPKKTVCGAPCANKGFCEYVVNQGFFGDLRCAPELISLHKTSFLPSCFPRFFGLRPPFLALRLLSPPQGYTSAENKNRFGSLHCALLLILLFEVLLFGFLMTQSLTSLLSSFFQIFLACGTSILCLAASSSPPPQGHKPRPKEVDACLFNDQARQQSRNHSASPYSQPSSTTSSRCSCVRSSSQQQPAAATASQRCCHSTKHQEAPPQAGSAGVRCAGAQ